MESPSVFSAHHLSVNLEQSRDPSEPAVAQARRQLALQRSGRPLDWCDLITICQFRSDLLGRGGDHVGMILGEIIGAR